MENKVYLSASDMQRFRISSETFHKQFCRTQQMAETIAAAFNAQLAKRLAADDVSVPRITFLECFVYHLRKTDKNGSWTYRDVLAEKRLDAALGYKKHTRSGTTMLGSSAARAGKGARTGWASAEEEEGRAQGGRQPWPRACATSPPPPMPQAPQIASIPEGDERGVVWDDEEEDYSPSDLLARVGGGGGVVGGKRKLPPWEEDEGEEEFHDFEEESEVILPEHIPQVLVCDLQGVYNDRNNIRGGQVHPTIFELRDPVIHHAATDARGAEADKRVYRQRIREPRGCNTFSGRRSATQRAVCFNCD